jgi:hypothetical protein
VDAIAALLERGGRCILSEFGFREHNGLIHVCHELLLKYQSEGYFTNVLLEYVVGSPADGRHGMDSVLVSAVRTSKPWTEGTERTSTWDRRRKPKINIDLDKMEAKGLYQRYEVCDSGGLHLYDCYGRPDKSSKSLSPVVYGAGTLLGGVHAG